MCWQKYKQIETYSKSCNQFSDYLTDAWIGGGEYDNLPPRTLAADLKFSGVQPVSTRVTIPAALLIPILQTDAYYLHQQRRKRKFFKNR